MTYVSLLLNIAILVPVCFALVSDASGLDVPVGEDTPARRILLCIYGAILVMSVVLLALLVGGQSGTTGALVVLLALQVFYKSATAFAIGLQNPVVQVNLVVVAVHLVTLASLYWASRV
ncbi:MAG: hypothetical protein AAF340_18235 [Pseudomonadota bacterium]